MSDAIGHLGHAQVIVVRGHNNHLWIIIALPRARLTSGGAWCEHLFDYTGEVRPTDGGHACVQLGWCEMFEDWPVRMQPAPRRLVDPPQAVLVDLSLLINNPDDRFRRDCVPMHIKMEGLEFLAQVPGLLHAWARTTRGGWLALVSCDVPTGNQAGKLPIRQWCPARAVAPHPRHGD